MQLPLYQVDAFASSIFRGNPAAVVPLSDWLDADTMQRIAAENNLAETVFFVPLTQGFHIRWFTPQVEMDLCGHATLASAHVLYEHLGYTAPEVTFESASGPLRVSRQAGWLTLDFPSRPPVPSSAPDQVLKGIGGRPSQVLQARDFFLVYDSLEEILDLRPNPLSLPQVASGVGGIIVTAPGEDVDFVSRFFTPGASVFEDPVTGSAHCSLIPYWAHRLGKTQLTARQVSARGGELRCALHGDRVDISGQAVTYLHGQIYLP